MVSSGELRLTPIQKALDAISIDANVPTQRIPKPSFLRDLASKEGAPSSSVRDYLARKELDPLGKPWVVLPRVDAASGSVSLHFKRVWGQ